MTRKYIVTVLDQDSVLKFPVTTSSSQKAYDIVKTEWDKEHGKGDFEKHTVGVDGKII